MSKYSSTTHTTYNIGYHGSPKYRYNLLRYKAANILKKLIQEKTTELPKIKSAFISQLKQGGFLR